MSVNVINLDDIESAANNDKILTIDVSDKTDSTDGTLKLATVSQVASGGSGDMRAEDYDPQGVVDDAFSMGNMTETSTNKIFTSTERTKLTGIEAAADVTDTANVTSAGALMDSEVTDLAGIKALDTSTLQVKPTEGAFVDGDKTKLDGIETAADVTDATNVDAAGAVMNSDTSTASMSFVIDEDNMASDSATKVPTQQSVKAYVDSVGGGGGASQLSDLTDVNTSTATNRNVLIADGVDFESRALTEADISDLGTYQEVLLEGAFVDGDKTKLDNIETNADVTDATNVAAAGAVMDSELIATTAGAGDAGKPIKTNGSGVLDSTFYTDNDTTDHTALSNIGTNSHAQIDTHIASTSNPHSVSKSDVGLGSVENTALSTWAGTSNITTVGASAVTAHEGSLTITESQISDLSHDATAIQGVTVDDTDIANGKVLAYNSTSGNLEYETQSGGIANIVEDTTPQLGGDLDLNGNAIDFPTTPNITDVLDDDSMATASATALATSESIKAYIDSFSYTTGFNAIVAPSGGDYTTLGAALAAGETSIFVKEGTYNESAITPTNDDVIIVGESREKTIINMGANAFDASLRVGWIIRNIAFKGSSTIDFGGIEFIGDSYFENTGTGSFLKWYGGLAVNNVFSTTTQSSGYFLQWAGSHAVFQGNKLFLTAVPGSGITAIKQWSTITRCIFSDNYIYCRGDDDNMGFVANGATLDHMIFSGNQFYGNSSSYGTGIGFDMNTTGNNSSDLVITGNYFSDWVTGFYLEGFFVHTFTGNQVAATKNCLIVDDCGHVNITGNLFSSNDVASSVGVHLTGTSTDDCTIYANTFHKNTVGIDIDSGSQRTIVGANKFGSNVGTAITDSGTDTIYIGETDKNGALYFKADGSEVINIQSDVTMGGDIDMNGNTISNLAASTTATGVVELATGAETTTGTDATRAVTPDGLAESTIFGQKVLQATVVDYTTDTSTGDGKFYYVIPEAMNGMNLVRVHARVISAGTTGTTDIQIHNVTDAQDMLSTKLTIDSGETGSDTAATAAVINATYDDVATNDLLRVDVDAVSTTAAKGLILTMEFRLP